MPNAFLYNQSDKNIIQLTGSYFSISHVDIVIYFTTSDVDTAYKRSCVLLEGVDYLYVFMILDLAQYPYIILTLVLLYVFFCITRDF